MKLLIALAIFQVATAQTQLELFCSFQFVDGLYTCNLAIANPQGYDNFTEIQGTDQHLPGMRDTSVQQIISIYGSSVNFPRIFCEKFPNTKTIRANNLGIGVLSENSFSGCRYLTTLDLSNNRINSIDNRAFVSNSLLEVLILSRNELKFDESGTLENLQLLTYLGLDNNPLFDLPADFFRPFVRLQTLQLFNSSLLILRHEWFENLFLLTTLQLYGNFITEIPEEAFKNLLLLQSLQIDRNYIQILSSSAFPCRMQNLQSLNIYDNQIEAVDLEFFNRVMNLRSLNFNGNRCISKSFVDFQLNRDANLEEFAECFEGFEKILEEKNACRLFNHPNFGYTCEFSNENFVDGAFDVYRIHKNCLTDFEVSGVIFKNSQIAKIPQEVFQTFPNLENLEAENVKLETVPTTDCGENLKFINFGQNSIRTLSSEAFSGCQKIEQIILDENCVGRVQPCEKTFVENLTNLKTLSMAKCTCVDEKFDMTRTKIEQVEEKMRKCFKNWFLL